MKGFTDARGVAHTWDGQSPITWGVPIYAVAEREGRLLAMEPGYAPGLWELPGGGVRPSETRTETIAREVHEETADRVEAVVGAPVFVAEQSFHLRNDPDGEPSAFRHSLLLAARVRVAQDPDPAWHPLKGETIRLAWLPLSEATQRLRPLHVRMLHAIGAA